MGSFAADPICGGRGALSDGKQVIVARNVAVFWEVIGILAEAPAAAAECTLDNAHRGLCEERARALNVRSSKQKENFDISLQRLLQKDSSSC